MHKTHPIQDLDKYFCLMCEERFFLAVEQVLVCPKCGNEDSRSFRSAELEDETEWAADEVDFRQD